LIRVFMHIRVISDWEAWLHGDEVMPGLHLGCSQSHDCTTVNAVESNLLSTFWDVVHVIDEERPPGIDSCRSHVRRHLKVFQLHRQG
jgi:hypothetical protein